MYEIYKNDVLDRIINTHRFVLLECLDVDNRTPVHYAVIGNNPGMFDLVKLIFEFHKDSEKKQNTLIEFYEEVFEEMIHTQNENYYIDEEVYKSVEKAKKFEAKIMDYVSTLLELTTKQELHHLRNKIDEDLYQFNIDVWNLEDRFQKSPFYYFS